MLASLTLVLEEFKDPFSQRLGKSNITEHTLDTGNTLPIRIPPWQILFHYVDKIHAQLEDMVKEGIIWPSTSQWCAPAVYVRAFQFSTIHHPGSTNQPADAL